MRPASPRGSRPGAGRPPGSSRGTRRRTPRAPRPGGAAAATRWSSRHRGAHFPAPDLGRGEPVAVESHERVEHVEQDRRITRHRARRGRSQPSSARAARTAAIITASFARLSSTVRVLRPQSGSTQMRSAGRTEVPRRIRACTSCAGLHGVGVDVEHSQREVLGERVLLEHPQEVEGAVRDREVEVVHRQVEESRIDRLECAEARVDDVVGGQAVDRRDASPRRRTAARRAGPRARARRSG